MTTVSGMCISHPRFSGQCREFSILRASLQSDCNPSVSWDHGPKHKGSLALVTGGVPESGAFLPWKNNCGDSENKHRTV